MVFYLILLLLLSIAGMLALLGAKRYELATGNLIFAGARPKLSRLSARVIFLFGTAIPLYLRWQANRAYRTCVAWMHRTTAHGVLKIEQWLESVLEGMYGRMEHHKGGDSIRHQSGRARS